MVKAHGQVDSDIEDLLALLREVLVHAASCEGDDIKKQAVKLVGDSASIIDGWVHSRSGSEFQYYVSDELIFDINPSY